MRLRPCCEFVGFEESATNGSELCRLPKTALARCVAIPVPPDSIQEGEFERAMREIGRPEGVWLLWNGDLNPGVRVAIRRERAGALEDQYAQLHLYTAPVGSIHPSSHKMLLTNMFRRVSTCRQNSRTRSTSQRRFPRCICTDGFMDQRLH
jgi:hypothetical protein